MKTRLMLLALCLICAQAATAATIVLVADPWPPYNNAPDDTDRGYIVDIADAIFSRHGHQVVYKTMAWKVAIEETRKGTYDGLIGADREDGAGMLFPMEEIGTYQIGFFVKKGTHWKFTDVGSLEEISLGVAEGYGYVPWLRDYIDANKKDFNRVQSASGEFPLEINLRKLIAGRIGALTATSATALYTAQKMGLRDQIQFAGSGGAGSNIYLVFSPVQKSSREYVRLLDEGLREMRASGELAKILARYGLSDWK